VRTSFRREIVAAMDLTAVRGNVLFERKAGLLRMNAPFFRGAL
jgi:hypothetical protein